MKTFRLFTTALMVVTYVMVVSSCSDNDDKLPMFREIEEYQKSFKPTPILNFSEYYNTECELIKTCCDNLMEWEDDFRHYNTSRIVGTSDGIRFVSSEMWDFYVGFYNAEVGARYNCNGMSMDFYLVDKDIIIGQIQTVIT